MNDDDETQADPVTKVARDLTEILRLHDALPDQAMHHADSSLMPGGESMAALATVANIEAWANMHQATERHDLGRTNYRRAYTSVESEDPDEGWSAYQLIEFWSEQWRREHGSEYDMKPTIKSEAKYVRYCLDWAWDNEIHWDEFAADIRRARLRLEDIVYAGKRSERTRTVCDQPDCTKPRLIRIRADDITGEGDFYKCPACKHRFTEDEYQKALRRMLMSEGAEQYVKQSDAIAILTWQGRGKRTVHRWLEPPKVVDRCTICRKQWPEQEYACCPKKRDGEQCGGELERVLTGDADAVIDGFCDPETHTTWLWWPDLWRRHLSTRTTPRSVAKTA